MLFWHQGICEGIYSIHNISWNQIIRHNIHIFIWVTSGPGRSLLVLGPAVTGTLVVLGPEVRCPSGPGGPLVLLHRPYWPASGPFGLYWDELIEFSEPTNLLVPFSTHSFIWIIVMWNIMDTFPAYIILALYRLRHFFTTLPLHWHRISSAKNR